MTASAARVGADALLAGGAASGATAPPAAEGFPATLTALLGDAPSVAVAGDEAEGVTVEELRDEGGVSALGFVLDPASVSTAVTSAVDPVACGAAPLDACADGGATTTEEVPMAAPGAGTSVPGGGLPAGAARAAASVEPALATEPPPPTAASDGTTLPAGPTPPATTEPARGTQGGDLDPASAPGTAEPAAAAPASPRAAAASGQSSREAGVGECTRTRAEVGARDASVASGAQGRDAAAASGAQGSRVQATGRAPTESSYGEAGAPRALAAEGSRPGSGGGERPGPGMFAEQGVSGEPAGRGSAHGDGGTSWKGSRERVAGRYVDAVMAQRPGAGEATGETGGATPPARAADGPPSRLEAAAVEHEARPQPLVSATAELRAAGQGARTHDLPPWAERIAEGVRLSALRGGTEMRVQLDPPGLGHIDLRVCLEHEGVRAVIVTEHEATKALIREGQHALQTALGRSELRLAGFSVHVGSGGAHGFTTPDGQRPRFGGAGSEPVLRALAPAELDPVNVPAAFGRGRLSLRV